MKAIDADGEDAIPLVDVDVEKSEVDMIAVAREHWTLLPI